MRPRAAALLLSLLLAPALLPVVAPPARAVNEPGVYVRFDRDPANYMQGEKIGILLQGTFQPGMEVQVNCNDCPDKRIVYVADYAARLTFPDSFTRANRSAVADRQPHWNGTWHVAVVSAGVPIVERDFRVWVSSAFALPNGTAHPTEKVRFRASGFQEEDQVHLLLRHRLGGGSFETILEDDLRADASGVVELEWTIPKEEARRLSCPPRREGYCWLYRVELHGPNKPKEVENFSVAPAQLHMSVWEAPGAGAVPGVVQRSSNVSMGIELRYPNKDRLLVEDVESLRNPDGTLVFSVQRIKGQGATQVVETVTDLIASQDPATRLWRSKWTVPKDEPVRHDTSYRVIVLKQKDRWGNEIKSAPIANFTIIPAILNPMIVRTPERVERTTAAEVLVLMRYKDGSPFEPKDNATTPKGCFVKYNPTAPSSCSTGTEAKVRYVGNGTWAFSRVYPRTYEDVQEHRFLYRGGPVDGADKHGNYFENNVSPLFRVVIAKPRINFSTSIASENRNASVGFERGSLVSIVADIRYPDGSPFNATLNADGRSVLNVTLSRINADGALIRQDAVLLKNHDTTSGAWSATLYLSKDSSVSPTGNWTFDFRVRDNESPPNRNESTFTRPVRPAPIQVVPHREPQLRVPIGSPVDFRFSLRYADGDIVTPDLVGSRLRVAVWLIRPADLVPVRAVTGPLLPTFEPGRNEWTVEWTVPPQAFASTFAFRIDGEDRHGNVIEDFAFSRTFVTITDTRIRAALTEPNFRAERGQSVFVVFDGREGDVGESGRGGPAVELQRFDPLQGQWVTERRNVRVPAPPGEDHVGRWNTTLTTTLGLYRFLLRGRDGAYNLINGTSESFQVYPTNVTRPMLVPPPDRVAKGQLITFSLGREQGDRIFQTDVRFNGRPLTGDGPSRIAGPIYITLVDRFNVSWRVPFQLDNGNYTISIRGLDLHGNLILSEIPPVQAEPSVLAGEILGDPDRIVKRSEEARFLFAMTYPSGEYFQSSIPPRVLVTNASGLVAEAKLRREALSYEASWKPKPDTPLEDYRFEITGTDSGGNVYPALRSAPFRLAPGEYTRQFTTQPYVQRPDRPVFTVNRLQTVTAQLARDGGDDIVTFTLGYITGDLQLTQIFTEKVESQPVGTLQSDVDPATGRYLVRWPTARDTKPGAYRIEFQGEDEHGNAFTGQSTAFTLQPSFLSVEFDPLSAPKLDDFKPGAVLTWKFRIRYLTFLGQKYMDNTMGTPTAQLYWILGQNQNADRNRPEVKWIPEEQTWAAVWQAPEVLPDGRYILFVQGADDAGNQISTQQSAPIDISTTFFQSLTKVVPGPADYAPLAALALAALAMRRRRGAK